jgi:hypothetical protein
VRNHDPQIHKPKRRPNQPPQKRSAAERASWHVAGMAALARARARDARWRAQRDEARARRDAAAAWLGRKS